MGDYKQSGSGRELGKEGLEEYLISKHIFTNTKPEPVIGLVNKIQQ